MDHYLDIAIEAARAGGEELVRYYGKLQHIREKTNPGDLVTEADLASEKRILEIFREKSPEATIISEEAHPSPDQLELAWVVDPLDGTTNYSHSLPVVAVSIALVKDGQPVVGVIYNPLTNELFEGSKGGGARLNGETMSVSSVDSLSHSLLATGFAYDRWNSEDPNYLEFCHITDISQGVRRLGAAAVDLAYVAAGRLDGYWEHGLNIWDIAAGVLLVEEAGGQVTAYRDQPLDLISGQIIATNQKLHPVLSKELERAQQWRASNPIILPELK